MMSLLRGQRRPDLLLYGAARRLIPLDITHILLLNTQNYTPSSSGSISHCSALSLSEIRALTADGSLGISEQLADDYEKFGYTAVVAKVENRIAAISFFAAHSILPRHNSGGSQFQGIGLQLPSDTRYLFKVFVTPEFRGSQLFADIITYALAYFSDDRVNAIVTTTDISNLAFLKSTMWLGFKRVGIAGECKLLGKHRYRLPNAIDSQTGLTSSSSEHAITFGSDS